MVALAIPAPEVRTCEPAGAVLFHWGISPFCYKVRMAAAYKGLRFDERIHGLDEMSAAKRATGSQKTPVIQAANGWVTDSTNILEWLEAQRPVPSLYPEGARVECQLLEDWADEALNSVVEPFLWMGGARLSTLHRLCVSEQRGAKNRFAMWAFKPLIHSRWRQRVARHGGPEGAARVLRSQLALLEERLAGQWWLFGEQPSAADFAVAGVLLNLLRFGCGECFEKAPGVEALVRRAGALLPEAGWLEREEASR